jgi:glycyl-tRNA synthetase beta chain
VTRAHESVQAAKSTARAKSPAPPSNRRGEFLLEIGCEEIPAGMIARAAQELQAILAKHLTTTALVDEPTAQQAIETFGAPRRLAAIVRGVRLRQDQITREITGPPKSVAFDSLGEPTRAAMSFAAKQGLPVSKLSIIETPKGEYLAAKHVVEGQPASQILSSIIPHAIREISWPRTMYWATPEGPRFIRPIRWLVAMLDRKVIPIEFAGLRAGNHSRGHRFLGSWRIPLLNPREYEPKLKKNFVLVRPSARRRKIQEEIRTITSRRGLRAHEDEVLLDAVTYLNEYPTVILGDFEAEFLALPDEILITVMRGHQKYFALENRSGGLAPHFLAVINLPRDAKALVRQGHQRVLRARFADAKFFWQTDQKKPLESYLPKLAAVTYERRLGSYADKVERVRHLARWLAEQWFNSGINRADVAGSDRAAELAKCDLVTEMVREFTELQGIVGGLYARAQGEPEEIASAIYDHYKPLGLEDSIPRNLTGCIVALADKFDTLVACFAVGIIPTGSSDAFALRRAALGVVKIILERKLPLSVSTAIAVAARGLKTHAPHIEAAAAAQRQVLEFLLERAKYIQRERHGFAYDEINAAFAAGADDLLDAAERLAAVKAIRATRNFEPLAASFKRIRNILEKSAGKGDRVQNGVHPELLKEAAELQLYTAARRIGDEVAQKRKERKYRAALERISELRPAVDFFFDKVLVMAEDENIRRNRIALLGGLLKEFSTIADFSELGAEEPK